MGSLLSLEDVSRFYGSGDSLVKAIRDATFSVDSGEFVAIMGPSGSGKSTILSILGAMNPPTTGKMVVDGIDVYSLSAERKADFRREYLGFVFQQLQLVPYLTSLENVMLPLVVSSRHDHEERATAVLERVGLGGKSHRLPSELSGGEQGRVAIARAVVNDPPIILADEPTGSLDTKTGDEILSLFKELHDEGRTILMVTHNLEATRGAERLIQIKDGAVFADGPCPHQEACPIEAD